MSSVGGKSERFTVLDFSKVTGGAAAALSRIPSEPGVYAFFRQIQISSTAGIEQFVKDVTELVNQTAASEHRARCGPLHQVALHSLSTLSERKEAQLRQFAEEKSFRELLVATLTACTLLQAPLYVGKADQLRIRIGNHLDPASDLSKRFRSAGIAIEKCVLVYSLVDADADALPESVLFLIEEIVSRICRPGFVLRIG